MHRSVKSGGQTVYTSSSSGYHMNSHSIDIKINSDAFHESFHSTNTTHVMLCGLMLFKGPDDCGLPEEVPNAQIFASHSEGYVRYKCDDGYKLVGNEIVRCSKLGNWMVSISHNLAC